ncbi:hypothetical protein Hanom_Chr01g00052521 [Helianthus anomalus]
MGSRSPFTSTLMLQLSTDPATVLQKKKAELLSPTHTPSFTAIAGLIARPNYLTVVCGREKKLEF